MKSTEVIKEFVPGSTGWTVVDLDDPDIEHIWEGGHFEILEGVLASMPAAYYDNTIALERLIRQVQTYLDASGLPSDFSYEPDLIISETRVVRPDAVYMSAADLARQRHTKGAKGRHAMVYGRLLVPPTLVIENVSEGHEVQDRVVKHRWYAEFGIPNYWILNPRLRTLECLRLTNGEYHCDMLANARDQVKPACFSGLTIDMSRLWV